MLASLLCLTGGLDKFHCLCHKMSIWGHFRLRELYTEDDELAEMLMWFSLLRGTLILLPPPVAVHFRPRTEALQTCLYHGQVPNSFTSLWNKMSGDLKGCCMEFV